MTPIGTKLATLFSGKRIGTDAFGNVYYEQRYGARHNGKPKRWVIYKGQAEPTKVPAQWHGWLHYTHDAPIANPKRYGWQKDHLPNLTGTVDAYYPPGHDSRGGQRAKASGDYQAWTPES